MTAVLSMRQAAAEVGMSYDRFRKEWAGMRAALGFPAPFLAHKWDAEAVRAWRRERSHAAPGIVGRAPKTSAGARARARLDAVRAA